MNRFLGRSHGILRGLDSVKSSPLFQGRFGRMFRRLPPAPFQEADLKALAAQMVAKPEATPTPETQDDDEENSGISAGYTYLGQFIDHDVTFDPASSLMKKNDPDALVDYRTPRFDLDNIYGRGPDDQPYLYAPDGLHMLLGNLLSGNPHDPKTTDLPRNSSDPKRALIGDPRNDENTIVSQLQMIFLRFHNRVVDLLGPQADFDHASRMVRWHYQWIVLNDFLPTIVNETTIQSVLPHLKNKTSIAVDVPKIRYFHWKHEPFMPVEFSVAAYRFGHSMVRPIYRLNTTMADRLITFSIDPNVPNLTGFQEVPDGRAVEWNLFFEMQPPPVPRTSKRLQPAYKIDSSLVNVLGNLPPSIAAVVPSLAQRNLLRGWRMSLPSGQSVARAMGVKPIDDDLLKVGKANQADSPTNPRLIDVSPRFAGNAPLWYYVLAEAQQQFVNDKTPIRLGEVGGRIVAETMVGLMLGDPHSFLSQDPYWEPLPDFLNADGEFGIAELITAATQA